MKDIVISGRVVRRELFILLALLVVAEGCNLGAILTYHRPFTELVTPVGFVLTLTLLLYLATGVLRFVIWLILRLFRKKK